MIDTNRIIAFLKNTFEKQKISNAVIAVSGGIDSAVSLSLLARALPTQNIFPLLLPYKNQNMDDAKTICAWNSIPESQWQTINIEKPVQEIALLTDMHVSDHVRLGNVMARVRMILVYDLAKKHNALVCGTENKSEHYLGYFTRFGDAASDIEPIASLYKTEVRELATQLQLPPQFLSKQPSAGLWDNQTDEQELGFTYEQADAVLRKLIDEKVSPSQIKISTIPQAVVDRIIARVNQHSFKHEVPYAL